MFEAIAKADPVIRDQVLKVIAGALDIEQPMPAGFAAVTGGAIVENGATASILARPLMTYLPNVLRLAGRLYELIGAAMPPPRDGEKPDSDDPISYKGRPVPTALAEQIMSDNPKEASAFLSLDMWCLPMIACLSTSSELRREAAGTELLDVVSPLTSAGGAVKFLTDMLRVLDDEPLLVLHPESRAGFECRISGISCNFQLHTLLADALIRNPEPSAAKPGLLGKLLGNKSTSTPQPSTGTWLTGQRPSAAVVAVSKGSAPQQINEVAFGVWNLYNWQALSPQGGLPDKAADKGQTWVWNEGCPADIEKFEGVRTVLLGPPAYERSWRATRDFDGLKASVKVERVMTADDVVDRLRRIAAASR